MLRDHNREIIPEPGSLVVGDVAGKEQYKNHNHSRTLPYSKR